MGRITNSNTLRLGISVDWLGSYSLRYNLFIFQYLPFLLDRLLYHSLFTAFYGSGPISLHYASGRYVTVISLYDFQPPFEKDDPFVSLEDLHFRRLILLFFVRILYASFHRYFSNITLLVCLKQFNDFDSAFVLSYFKMRLHQDYTTMQAFKDVCKLLDYVPGLLGFRIDITGRYGKQPRATKFSFKRGNVTLSSLTTRITLSSDFIVLKHGKCGFKIWVNRSTSLLPEGIVFQS
jgi:hypothetical protein